MVTRSEGRVHTLTLRDVKLEDAGEVQLTAKDFKTQANLFVKGNYRLIFLNMYNTELHKCQLSIIFNLYMLSNIDYYNSPNIQRSIFTF